ncbi:MAG: phosphatidylglycerophosphatase A [Rickettsiaceae bacterium]|nr:phosphatidylglycerophosphatase A [Rickettsiaceae bacterium]
MVATVGYIGKIKYAPGTFGSLVAFPLCYIIMYFTFNNQIIFPINGLSIVEQSFITLLIIELSAILILFIIGTYCTRCYIENLDNKDPKEVVIDEVVGQMLVINLCSMSIVMLLDTKLKDYMNGSTIDFIFLFLSPFILFRLFDIFKPWPINWLDKNIKGALGVMIDDVAAAIFAIIAHYVMIFILLDFYAK